MIYDVIINGKPHRLELDRTENRWSCRLDGRAIECDAILVEPDMLSLRIGSQSYEIVRAIVSGEMQISVGARSFAVSVRDPRSLRARARAIDELGPRKLTAPMPGKVVRVLVKEGEAVEAGAGVVVVEAMKMQNEIKSPKSGTIKKLAVTEGAAVNAGDVLAIVE